MIEMAAKQTAYFYAFKESYFWFCVSIYVCLEPFCFSERVNSSMSVQSLVRNPHLLPFGVISHAAVLSEPILSKADLETVVLYFCFLSPVLFVFDCSSVTFAAVLY